VNAPVRPVCLPPRWLQVLLALHRLSRLGYPPTLRELKGAVGLKATSNMNYQLRGLERAGLAVGPPHMQAPGWRANYDPVMFETIDSVMTAWEYELTADERRWLLFLRACRDE